MSRLTPEVLGRLAADHELLAADPRLLPIEREYFSSRAKFYRDEQWRALGVEPIRQPVLVAPAPLAMPSRDYPLANVLVFPRWRRIIFAALKALAAIIVWPSLLVAFVLSGLLVLCVMLCAPAVWCVQAVQRKIPRPPAPQGPATGDAPEPGQPHRA